MTHPHRFHAPDRRAAAAAQPLPAARAFDRRRWLALACGAAAACLLAQAGPARAQAPMTEGEVRKVDREAGKVTLRHGPIAHLDMPAMTMVFRVAEPKLLTGVKEGDRIRFAAERVNGQFTVTAVEAAK